MLEPISFTETPVEFGVVLGVLDKIDFSFDIFGDSINGIHPVSKKHNIDLDRPENILLIKSKKSMLYLVSLFILAALISFAETFGPNLSATPYNSTGYRSGVGSESRAALNIVAS